MAMAIFRKYTYSVYIVKFLPVSPFSVRLLIRGNLLSMTVKSYPQFSSDIFSTVKEHNKISDP